MRPVSTRTASASSTTSTVSPRPRGALGDGSSSLARRTAGSSTVTVVPRARLGVELDPPARLGDDPVDRGQPEPDAVAGHRLGGEERLEGVRGDLARHPAAGVGDGQPHGARGRAVGSRMTALLGLDRQRRRRRASPRASSARGSSAPARAGCGRPRRPTAGRRTPRSGRRRRRACAAAAARRSRSPAAARAPRACRTGGGENSSSRRVSSDARREAVMIWSMSPAARDAVGELLAHERGVVGDHREQVVEVVRDAARELADRLQPLRLAQARLQPDVVGDVGRDAADAVELAARRRRSAGT